MLDPSKMFQSSGMVESKSVGTFSPLQKQESQRGLFVDRGVGSPRLVKSSSSNIFSTDLNLDNETKVCIHDFHFLFIVQIYCQSTNLLCFEVSTNNCLFLYLFIDRIQCQLLLEPSLLQLLLIRCWVPRKIDIWELSWYFSGMMSSQILMQNLIISFDFIMR